MHAESASWHWQLWLWPTFGLLLTLATDVAYHLVTAAGERATFVLLVHAGAQRGTPWAAPSSQTVLAQVAEGLALPRRLDSLAIASFGRESIQIHVRTMMCSSAPSVIGSHTP